MSLFKECLGTFATGVTIITIEDRQGITVNSFCSLSLDPPLILFNLEKKAARFKVFCECNDFYVNILSEQQQILSQAFSKLDEMSWQKYFCDDSNLPILKDTLYYIHCTKHQVYDGGDHKIIVGEVQKMEKLAAGKPLIYYQGNYHKIQNEQN